MKNYISPILSDPEKEKLEQTRRQAKAHLERLNGSQRLEVDSDDPTKLALNEYENLVALEMVAPEDINVGFKGETCTLEKTT